MLRLYSACHSNLKGSICDRAWVLLWLLYLQIIDGFMEVGTADSMFEAMFSMLTVKLALWKTTQNSFV
jgi:hypothetical protein